MAICGKQEIIQMIEWKIVVGPCDRWNEFNASKTIINYPFGNGKHSTYKNGDDWGMVYYCFNHITLRNDLYEDWSQKTKRERH